MKAAAGVGAVATVGVGIDKIQPPIPKVAHAQEVDGTRARSWSEDESINTNIKLEGEGWVTLQTEFPFWALGFGWDIASGTWPAVEFGVSFDGELWDDGYFMAARNDGGPQAADNRHHTDLFFADGHEFIRYRTMDGEGNLVILERFQVTYIDPTDGPWEKDRGITMMRTTATNSDTDVPPSIISRAQWGANEDLRFSGGSEIWPSEYQTVEHAIVHHAAVNYGSDGYNAVRSIYYYHAITQGWGDIGYNYVVDVNGNIFEGRVGGANVIGGHAFEYANGSSGICVMGDFTNVDPPWASKVALANIVAYVTRDLNPHGSKPFHSVPALPTISAHRDVNQSSCPGNALYDDLPWLRNQVKSILDQGLLDSQNPGGIVPGDWVRVQTENEADLPMRSQPGTDQLVIANIPYNTLVEVERGPLSDSMYNWYLVHYDNKQGWVPADYLLVDPPIEEPTDGYTYGQNVRLTATTSLRDTPNGSVVATVSSGSWAFIMAGATPAGGNTWFQLRTQSNGDGWVTRSSITLAPVYNPTPRFPVGSNVVTTVSAPIRVRPGIAQTTGGTVPAGRTLQVSVAPIAVTDRIWYGVYGGTGTGGGWMEEGHLRAGAGSITVVGPVSAPGQQFRVTEAVNMRTAPGTGNSIVATLAVGVMGTVSAGPQSASGYTWWQVRTDSNQQGWVVTNYIQQIRTGSDGELTGFGVGVTVRTNSVVNMRSDAGTGYSVIGELASNTNAIIIDGPRISTGYTWWRLRTADGRVGWVAQTYLVRTSGPLTKLTIGENAEAHPYSHNLRTGPSTSNPIIVTMPIGTVTTVLDGPVEEGGYTWWQLQTQYGIGWATEDRLRPTTKTAPKFAKDRNAEVYPYSHNLRTGPSTSNPIIVTMPVETVVTILDGPVDAGGYKWWKLRSQYGIGWATEDRMRPTAKTAPKFAHNENVEVHPYSHNLRTGASTSNPIIVNMPVGTVATVLDGPVAEGGYVWWQIRTIYGTGWATEDRMRSTNTIAPKFVLDGNVEVYPYSHNLRTGASTSNPIIVTMPVGTVATVLDGPVEAGGYTWWQIESRFGIGWATEDRMRTTTKTVTTFATGDEVEVQPYPLRLRSDPSINAEIITTMPVGTPCTILGGPEYADNVVWWNVSTQYGDGWASGEWLRAI